jgi:predicted nucleic acid-binding protein
MIYFRCRRMGITIRSTIDVLIIQTALENELFLLHDDKDFTAIKKAVPGLKVYQLS